MSKSLFYLVFFSLLQLWLFVVWAIYFHPIEVVSRRRDPRLQVSGSIFHLIVSSPLSLVTGKIARARILVQVAIYRRLQIGRDGHLDQSEAYDIS